MLLENVVTIIACAMCWGATWYFCKFVDWIVQRRKEKQVKKFLSETTNFLKGVKND